MRQFVAAFDQLYMFESSTRNRLMKMKSRKTGTVEKLMDFLRQRLSSEKPLKFVYLFGLRSPGRVGKLSDLDIAVFLRRDAKGMGPFCNGLVHDYLRIDLDKIYHILQSKIPCVEKLGIAFNRLISREALPE